MQLNTKPTPRMVRGEGSYLWDEQGRRYVDFIQGWAVNCLGHDPPVLRQALAAQPVINPGPAFHNTPSHALAELLAQVSGLSRVFLSSSGAEANEGAVKLARKWGQLHRGGAYEVITAVDSFHGRTLAMSSATGKPGFADAFGPHVPGFRKVPYGDVAAVERALGPSTVAVMVEPIQGEAGAVVPPAGYLRALRALCDRAGVLLIADEIQTGMGRTGPMFAFMDEGIQPDIVTVGKGLGGGLPVSAVLARREVACFAPGDHGGTFAAHAFLCAGALAVVRTLLALDRAASALALERVLRELAERHGLTLRGRGHLWGLVLPTPRAEAVRDRCFERGLLINAARPNVLRLMPALDVGAEPLRALAEILETALN
ncbi:MAG TPA: aminotransferase class III-fold pyridoxal phosphate-dependent enzyme [Polyangiales bacterium]